MKSSTKMLYLLLAWCGSLLLPTGCSRNIAGATTETTNGIAGVIRNGDDSPATGVVVRLFTDDYNPVADSLPGANLIDTTDKDGAYRFSRVAAGSYAVLARNRSAATSVLVRNVTANDDSLTVASAGVLDKSGSIAADFSSGGITDGGYVYIPGTDIATPVNNSGATVLADVPQGIITAVVFATGDIVKRNVLRETITLAAGARVTIVQPLWMYSCRIGLNTMSSGAGVSGDVYDFPVLIRLTPENFDFTQAAAAGDDLRFTTSRGTPLSLEIEQWDAAKQRAAIWVNVDTVRGNDSLQSITMYWGASTLSTPSTSSGAAATSESNSAAVFDTANGFQGVWHFGGTAGDPVSDATANRYDGTSPDTARPQVAEGVAGNCRTFDGTTDYVTMPNTANSKLNFPVEGQYTVSAWVMLDSLDNSEHLIVAKGYEQYFVRFSYFPSDSPLWEFSEFGRTNSWQACTTTATGGKWTLLTGVRKGTTQLLYCNGVLVCSTPNVYQSPTLSRNTSYDLSIGKFLETVKLPNNNYGSCFFKGAIDEVRILSTAQSAGWVRLCYMNQRSDDRLVVFR